MNQIKKVIIVGAGSAGLLAALRCKRYNKLDVAMYELKSGPTTLGGAVGIPSNGLLLFQRLGLYDEIVAHGSLTANLVVHSTKGHTIGRKSMAGYGERQLGFAYLRIRRTDLIAILIRAVQKEGVKIHFNHKLVGVTDGDKCVRVEFSNGAQDSADLLLGCDGIHSAVRQLHVDPDISPTYSGISNIYGLVSTDQLPSAAAHLDDLNATLTTNGLLAVTACTSAPENMAYWFFSRQVRLPDGEDLREGWEQTGKREVENLKEVLLQLLGDSSAPWTTFLRQMVMSTESMKFYPIYSLPIDQKWSRGRCLLLGDSAHAMPPHISQGTSMAAEDVVLITKLLAENKTTGLEDIFVKFENIRRPRTSKLLATAYDNGAVRYKIPSWRLALNEVGFSLALKLFNILSLDYYGVGQKEIAYDIEQEKL